MGTYRKPLLSREIKAPPVGAFFLLSNQKDGHTVTVQKRVSVILAYARDQSFII